MTRTIAIPANDSALNSEEIRDELQALETEITNISTGHDHDGTDSKAITIATLGAEASGATATHSALTTGVHGVGAGTVAKTSDITATKLDDLTAPDDNTDLNANTTNHGLLLKATAPAANELNVVGIGNAETAYTNKDLFNITNPAALGTASSGTAVQASRSDHIHANPAIDTLAAATDITTLDASTTAHGLVVKATAPASGLVNVVGIANAETAYTNKALFDATVPSTQAFGDAAAAGSATVSARRDHKHAMPAAEKDTTAQTGILKGNGSAISAASQGSDYYAPSGTDVAVVDGGTGASTASAALTNLGIKVVRKTADETVNNSDTLQDDDALLFAIGANEVWLFQSYIRFSYKAASDFKYDITVPAGASGGFNTQNSSAATTNEIAYGSAQSLVSTSDQNPTIRAHGVVANGATSGNVLFRWAQNAAVAEDTKVLANSYIIAIKLA